MTPRRKTAAQMYEVAFAALEAAAAQSRVEQAESEARLARLKMAAELERMGRAREAATVLRGVEREQERLR